MTRVAARDGARAASRARDRAAMRVLTWQPLRAARALAFVALVVGVALVDALNAEEGRDALDAGGAVNGTTLGKEEIERAAIGGAAALGHNLQTALAVVWQHFSAGQSQTYTTEGHHNINQVGHDQISSAWVRPGYRLILWQHGADNGEPLTMYGGYTDLHVRGYMGDQASWAEVYREAPCTLFHHDRGYGRWADFWTIRKRYYSHEMGSGNWNLNDRPNSAYVAPGYTCTIWQHHFDGQSVTLYPGFHFNNDFVWNNQGDQTSSVYVDWITPPSPPPSPPPPSPPPPSPPPPSPPPPGEFKEPVVSVTNPTTFISAFSYDFGIKVAHVSCDNDADCFESQVADEVNTHRHGLRCEVNVARRDDPSCVGPSEWQTHYMPCRKWNDFLPKTLELTDVDGKILSGTYDITYACYFVYSNGAKVESQLNWKHLHTFELHEGCAESLPSGKNGDLQNVARQLLLTADEFNVADCRNETQVYKAKESVFRRHDNDPTDGVLSYREIVSALQKQSADTYAVKRWNEALHGALELKPAHVMRVETNDMACGGGTIVYDDAIYPSDSPGRDSTLQQCSAEAASMRVAWHYNTQLSAGDFVCIYVDGLLYDTRSVTRVDPQSSMYSEVGGLYAPTKLEDIRPLSGIFEDVQQTLVANFLFDDDTAQLIVSAAPSASTKPRLQPEGTTRDIAPCTGGDGGRCVQQVSNPGAATQYGYKYKAPELFSDDFALTTWMYSTCANNAGNDVRRKSIAYFTGENGGVSHLLRFYVNQASSIELVVEYVRDGRVTHSLTLTGIACDSWHYVGFSLNKRDKLVVFADLSGAVDDLSDTNSFKTMHDMDADAPRKILRVMDDLEILGAVDIEFDDVRVYSGQVSRATFLDAFECGHRSVCAKRAHATPSSRRVICTSAIIDTKDVATYSDYFCAAAMYYDGSAIDVAAILDTSGVTFTYRDTSWEESSFEMLRKPVGEEYAAASYETIIQMDGDLKGCVNKFSSISYLDRQAGTKPNLEWYYKVRTKMASSSSADLVSTTHYFKTPWIGTIEGMVKAGQSQTPVPYVRICAGFALSAGTLMSPVALSSGQNAALYMQATHSRDMSKTAASKTFVVTDGESNPGSGFASLAPGEYLRVALTGWSSMTGVGICVTGSGATDHITAHIQDHDSGDSSDHGHGCERNDALTEVHDDHTCMLYECRGTNVSSFHGAFVTAAYRSDSDQTAAIGVTEIFTTGTKTNCAFSATTDAEGYYEINIRDTSGLIPVEANLLAAAYKEEIFTKTTVTLIDTSSDDINAASDPLKVLLVVRTIDATESVSTSEFEPFIDWDADNSANLTLLEFASFVEHASGFPTKGHAIISEDIWNTLDTDADGFLDVTEFNVAQSFMNNGRLIADPILVYTPMEAKYLSQLLTTRQTIAMKDKCENFVLARHGTLALPSNTSAWNTWYEGMISSNADPLRSVSSCTSEAQIDAVLIGDAETTKAIPMLVFGFQKNTLSLRQGARTSEADDIYQGIVASSAIATLSATQQYSDIVHFFDTTESPKSKNAEHVFGRDWDDPTEMEDNAMKLRHREVMRRDFADETASIVRGAVLFPKDWTAGSTTCGLSEATIMVREVGSKSKPVEYKTDGSGWFEIALTRGKSFEFNATFPKHTVCYTGRTVADAADEVTCDSRPQSVTLNRIGDGNYIFFTDVTQGNIDLGLYQGQCDAVYSGARFKVTPINGCHSPVYVTSEQIGGWMSNVKGLPEGKFTDVEPLPSNARVWPFAAMDYSIMLVSGPPVGLVGKLISNETWDCETESGDMVTFFRRRNALERLALMREGNDWSQIRYKYHGYICVDIPDAYIPKIANDGDICYDDSEPTGGLTSKHFLGTSTSQQNPIQLLISDKTEIKIGVFEIHQTSETTYAKCFSSLPNEHERTGSTKMKIRQDVSDAEDTECHPDRGGGESCDFQVDVDENGFVQFPNNADDAATLMTIKAGSPNLAGVHRRTVRVEVERNDLYRTVTATAIRYLIPLGSKPRVGQGESDDTFWATVPLDGLVYTVVHDPPGGDSYAEMHSGSTFKMEFVITGTRAMTAMAGTYLDSAFGKQGKAAFGFNIGYTAEASTEVTKVDMQFGGRGESVIDGPNYKVQSTMENSWDITMETSRVVKSSQDPALAGRAGDTIVGGGIELVYKLSDILDLSRQDGDKVCLQVQAEVTWLPRKPTTYALALHSIEKQVVPNLRFLLSAVNKTGGVSASDQSGKPTDITWGDYLTGKIASWERTLAWASPEDPSSITASFTGTDSIYGRNFDTKRRMAGGYNDLFEADDDYSSVATDLSVEWARGAGIDVGQAAPMHIIALLMAYFQNMFPTSPAVLMVQNLAFAPGAFIQEARILPYVRNDYDAGATDDSQMKNLFPDGKIPYTSSSIVHPQARNRAGLPDYDSKFKTDDNEVLYSFGMSKIAAESMDSWSDGSGDAFEGTVDEVQEEHSKQLRTRETTRIISSLSGGVGPVGYSQGSNDQPADEDILLTFSGGGNALEFEFNSIEALEDYLSHVSFEIEGTVKFKGGYHQKGDITAAGLGAYWDDNAGLSYGWNRDFTHDRLFSWSKYGRVTARYSLGDPEFGDKFVLSVGSDKRFGTPVFVTKGGRSMCPGEPGTFFRESSVSLQIPLDTKMNTERLNPGQRAIFEVVIHNESPYREASKFALRLVDGLAESLRTIVSAAYEEAAESSANGASVLARVNAVAATTIAKSSTEVANMKRAASDAADAGALAVAEAVDTAARAAPRENRELGDSTFRINGKALPIDDYLPFKFVGGDAMDRQSFISEQYMNFAVEPGFATRKIEYLQLRLQSLCETRIWENNNLYRDPISYTQNVDPMSWEPSCPKVAFTETTMSTYLSASVSLGTSSWLNLTVSNPDRYILWPDNRTNPSNPLMNPNLAFVRLQYRHVSGGEWITAKSEASPETDKKFNLLCPFSRSDGCEFDWNTNGDYELLLSGFKDGVYELRLKNFCTGGDSFADAAVHEYVGEQTLTLTVDTVRPVPTRVFSMSPYFGAVFDETIDCSNIDVSVTKIKDACGKDAVAVNEVVDVTLPPYKIKCSNSTAHGTVSIEFAPEDVGRYRVVFEGIKDGAGMLAHPVVRQFSKCGVTRTSASAYAAAEARLGRIEATGDDSDGDSNEYSTPSVVDSESYVPSITVFVLLVVAVVVAALQFRRPRAAVDTDDAHGALVVPAPDVSTEAIKPPSYGATV